MVQPATHLRVVPSTANVTQDAGGITIKIPAGEMRPDVIARLFADVVAISKSEAATRGSFEQYAQALAGLNGPAEGNPADHETSFAQVVTAGAEAFKPERFTWVAGQAPATYAGQLRDLAIALLRRIQAGGASRSAEVASQQASNVAALGAAYDKMLRVATPASGPVREVARYKVDEWDGSFWKDTKVKYEQTEVDRRPLDPYQKLGAELAGLAGPVRDGTLTAGAIEALVSKVSDYSRTVDGINASGLPQQVRAWSKIFD